VTCNWKESRSGMVRIFISPKYDENGKNFELNDQRFFFIEIDKFVASCEKKVKLFYSSKELLILFTFLVRPGRNVFKRRSTDSTVTIPYERTFRNLDDLPSDADSDAFNFCGCGW
jgi:tyrosinase